MIQKRQLHKHSWGTRNNIWHHFCDWKSVLLPQKSTQIFYSSCGFSAKPCTRTMHKSTLQITMKALHSQSWQESLSLKLVPGSVFLQEDAWRHAQILCSQARIMYLQTKLHITPPFPIVFDTGLCTRDAGEPQVTSAAQGLCPTLLCPRTHCCTLLCSSWPRPMLALIVDETFKIQTSSLARHEARVGSHMKIVLPCSPGISWCMWAALAYHWGSSCSNQQTGWEMHHSSGSSAFKELLWDCCTVSGIGTLCVWQNTR